jgi:hypothetical protein
VSQRWEIKDLLRTAVEHIVHQVTKAIESTTSPAQAASQSKARPPLNILVTGGGYFNSFLMRRLTESLGTSATIDQSCDQLTVNFKEALIFAFLGIRCLLGMPNVDQSVTGATSRHVIAGSVHLGALGICEWALKDEARFNLRLSTNRSALSDSSPSVPFPGRQRNSPGTSQSPFSWT